MEQGLLRLEEALAHPADGLFIDATIQRFEFTFEMFWKVLRLLLHMHDVPAASPRECISQAYRNGWLKNGEDFWMTLIQDRNLTSHVYNQNMALEIYGRIKSYHQAFSDHLPVLQQKIPGEKL